MERVLVAAVVVGVAAFVAVLVERRRPDPPSDGRYPVPTQVDRHDFQNPEQPWLVVVFSSATCQSCAQVVRSAEVLASSEVTVQEVEVKADAALHERYGIEAVPTVVVADSEGVVKASFVGPPSSTDLWAAVAEARHPGSSPEPGLGGADGGGAGA